MRPSASLFVSAFAASLAACSPSSPGGAGGASASSPGGPAGGGADGVAPACVQAEGLPGCDGARCDSDSECAAQAAGWCDESKACHDGDLCRHMGRCWPPRVDLEPCTRAEQCFAGACHEGICGAGPYSPDAGACVHCGADAGG
jgi:hypothetical protein